MAILAFQKPEKVIMLESTSSFGKFEFRPLEPGFGMTVGNALRRILLSSLEGYAITTVKVAGVDHEFAAIPGVMEDMLNIILNLKQVRFIRTVDNQDAEKVSINVAGVTELTAGYISNYLSFFKVLNPDLVICHHLYLLTALVAQMGLTCPVVAVCHNTDLRQMRSHGLERDFIRAGTQRLDGILALHDAQIPEIAQIYGVDPARIRVVGTGYNDAMFYPVEGLREPGLTRVVYAGKIARAKGVHSLLACLNRLPFAPGAFELHMAGGHGSPEEYQEARALAEKAPYPVTFEGKLCQPDLAHLYNVSDVFVLPSFCEGLPLVVVEALACGCKVVVTDLPGLRPWVTSQMPGAPVVYVEPPRMAGPDEPVAQDLPGFEERLAAALVEAAEMSQPTAAQARACTGNLSWTMLAERMLDSAIHR